MTLLWWVATAKSNRHAANIALAVAFSLASAASPSYAELARQELAALRDEDRQPPTIALSKL